MPASRNPGAPPNDASCSAWIAMTMVEIVSQFGSVIWQALGERVAIFVHDRVGDFHRLLEIGIVGRELECRRRRARLT